MGRWLGQVRLSSLPLSLLIFQIGRVIKATTCLAGGGQSDTVTVKVLENLKALCKYSWYYQNHYICYNQILLLSLITF